MLGFVCYFFFYQYILPPHVPIRIFSVINLINFIKIPSFDLCPTFSSSFSCDHHTNETTYYTTPWDERIMVAPLLRACRLGSCKLTLVRGQLCDDVARAPLIFVRLDPSISTLFDSANFIFSFIVMGVNI